MKKTLKALLAITLLAAMLMALLPSGALADEWTYYMKSKFWCRTYYCDWTCYYIVDFNNAKCGPYYDYVLMRNQIYALQEMNKLIESTSKKGSFPSGKSNSCASK